MSAGTRFIDWGSAQCCLSTDFIIYHITVHSQTCDHNAPLVTRPCYVQVYLHIARILNVHLYDTDILSRLLLIYLQIHINIKWHIHSVDGKRYKYQTTIKLYASETKWHRYDIQYTINQSYGPLRNENITVAVISGPLQMIDPVSDTVTWWCCWTQL